ncbi:hypothetical protein BO71DRAFT_395087 [Aspergillus ellipticus CBS 707.79]|uniref:Nitrogen regulatory protein areA GATA-like domain-containing protein n=1 Tax=Aspergillus ellipticus CBS 707.79 TaxID=1448320 RepID=A0A319F1Z8_9EURO|nr:hypothetical protein BO71DRAFT_395087 [Aspergillus ellipticus CBS 707.79]
MERLPEGLLSTATKVSTEMDGMGPVDVGDVVQLWRVYSANPSAHHDDVGYRLENFFWRIWSSHCLHHTLQGSTLANLFLRISESSALRLDPSSKAENARAFKQHSEEKPMEKHVQINSKPPLHPILKKPRNGVSNGEPHKTTRLLLTDVDGQSTVTRKPSNPLTPVPPAVPTMGDTAPRQTQKKAFVVPTKAKNIKRRPVIMRRKSSQQSSGTTSVRAQSPQPIPSLALDDPEKQPALDVTEVVEEVTAFPEVASDEPCDKGLFAEDIFTAVTSHNEAPDVAERPKDEDTPQDKQPPPQEVTPQDEDEENSVLPSDFVSDLVALLDVDRPAEVHIKPKPPRRRAFYSIKSSPPKPNFFSYNACRRIDPRYLLSENYEQPSSTKLVEKNFRQQFSERLRLEQTMFSSLGVPQPEAEPEATSPKSIRPESSSTITNVTLSPSGFGDSQGNISTAPSSTAVPLQTPSHDSSSAFSHHSHASTDEEAPALLAPFSMPPSRSQLSAMIERSRHEGTKENEQIRYRPEASTQEEIEEIME